MRVPVKLFGFIFWLFSLNCARCQECLQKGITYENIKPVVKASYNDNETVKVNCRTGFTGMYKLKCEKGKWKTNTARPCTKKKCGHPGDTENGDFKLTQGTGFVFGATVLYTCKKGFEMTSRINQRTCREKGWDNTLPVCEAVKCPAIHTDKGVTASDKPEEGRYGDIIHFECVSTDKKINGSSDIHCTETGEWSDSVPTCKEITCTEPVITNGYVVEKMKEYQKDAIFKYGCFKGFKIKEGIPRCTKFGWSMKPECDEIICELKSITPGVKKIKPKGKTVFRAGERVEITCAKEYWFLYTKETTKTIECKYDGKWNYEPACVDITCEVPYDQHVSRLHSNFRGDMKLGAKKYYSCMSDYDKMAEEAICTQNGWIPKPLCAVKMCAAPNITNAEIIGIQRPKYKIYSRIQYKCRPGFEPEKHMKIICNSQSEWTGILQCTEMCGPPPNVDFGDTKQFTKDKYKSLERVEYSCFKDYTLNKRHPYSEYLTCEQGQWKGKIKCSKTCSVTVEEMDKRGIRLKWGDQKNVFPSHEEGVSFECQKGKYLIVNDLRQICNDGVMNLPQCVSQGKENITEAPAVLENDQ